MGVKQIEALKLARDVMKHTRNCLYQSLAQDDVVCDCGVTMARAAIREALAEQPAQQQEPVAWATQMGEYAHIHWGAKRPEYPMVYEVPLYTPPPAQRKPLTDEEIVRLVPGLCDCLCDPYDYNKSGDEYASIPKDMIRLARAVESHHGITGEQK